MKKTNILAAFLVGATAFVAGAATLNNVEAKAADFTPTATDFYMKKGASVRTEENPGIRFAAYISDAYVAELGELNTDYEIGMAIVPKSVADTLDGFDVTKMDEFVSAEGVQVKPVKAYAAEDHKYAVEGYNLFMMSLVQIPESEEFWETAIIANAYIKDLATNEYTFVTDFTGNEAQVKDIAHVAAEAVVAGESGTILEQIIDVVSVNEEITLGVDVTNQGNVVVGKDKEVELKATTTSGYAVKLESANKDVVTVDKTGMVTGVATGYTNVTATFGEQSLTKTVKVYTESYDFEDGKTSGLNLFTGMGKSSVWTGEYESEEVSAPETFGEYGFVWHAGDTTGAIMNVEADYLEYVFADKNVAYVAFDLYMSGVSSIGIRRVGVTPSDKQVVEGNIVENTVYTYQVSRLDYEVLKETNETFQVRYYHGTSTEMAKIETVVDNVRLVKYQDLHTTNGDGSLTYSFDDKQAHNGIVYCIEDVTTLDYRSLPAVKSVDDVATNAWSCDLLNNNWVSFAISADYLYWAFEIKGATSVTFDVNIQTTKTGYIFTGLYDENNASTQVLKEGSTDYATSNEWGKAIVSKAQYEKVRDMVANAKASETVDIATLTHTPVEWKAGASIRAGIHFRVNNAANGSVLVDNLTLHFA